jgi:hydroxyacylglutathione hydrolase
MAELSVEPVPCLSDNYAYILFDPAGGFCAVVDPSEADPVRRALGTRKLTHIFNTHHHPDHIGGNGALKAAYGAKIIAAAKDKGRIPDIDEAVADGDVVRLGGHDARVIEIPAHTSAHVAYWFQADRAVFTGDTLFLMGCGRLFEGTPAMMHGSLARLMALPDETRVYCGHEYTENNGRFALSVEPQNPDLKSRMNDVRAARAQGKPTVPATMAVEKKTNPFLRTDSRAIRNTLGMADADNVAVFAELRKRKDSF